MRESYTMASDTKRVCAQNTGWYGGMTLRSADKSAAEMCDVIPHVAHNTYNSKQCGMCHTAPTHPLHGYALGIACVCMTYMLMGSTSDKDTTCVMCDDHQKSPPTDPAAVSCTTNCPYSLYKDLVCFDLISPPTYLKTMNPKSQRLPPMSLFVAVLSDFHTRTFATCPYLSDFLPDMMQCLMA